MLKSALILTSISLVVLRLVGAITTVGLLATLPAIIVVAVVLLLGNR